jgi:hypothetical protein
MLPLMSQDPLLPLVGIARMQNGKLLKIRREKGKLPVTTQNQKGKAARPLGTKREKGKEQQAEFEIQLH